MAMTELREETADAAVLSFLLPFACLMGNKQMKKIAIDAIAFMGADEERTSQYLNQRWCHVQALEENRYLDKWFCKVMLKLGHGWLPIWLLRYVSRQW